MKLYFKYQNISPYIYIYKGSCAVIWDGLDYLSESEKQLGDKNIYKDVCFNDKILRDLVEASNKMFLNLRRKGSVSEKKKKYFVYDYKNASNLGKLYFLLKIRKRLSNVPGRPFISNCGTPTQKASEFLDHHLKHVISHGRCRRVISEYPAWAWLESTGGRPRQKRLYTDFNIRSFQNGSFCTSK